MSLYRMIARPLLFSLDAEMAHHLAVEGCRLAGAIPLLPGILQRCLNDSPPELQTEIAGLKFSNPVGLAAGWDKSGRALRMLDHLGFGFAEIGSVSARASLGNPGKRLFRLPEDRAIVVNYGLPNDGARVVAQRLAGYRPRCPVGVNLVKTNDGPDAPECSPEEILADYVASATLIHPHAGYLALNLSCPNARGGVDFFAQPGSIRSLLERLAPLEIRCPVFLKLVPDPQPGHMERVLAEAEPFPFVKGFQFNLPAGKPPGLQLRTAQEVWRKMPGAVSGAPAAALINACVREMFQRMPRERYAIVAAGGVFSAEDAYEKIQLGASLVQLYTAMIYEGPGIVKRINRGLCRLLARDGHRHISAAVGTSVSSARR